MSFVKNYFFSLSIQVINILTPLITLPLVVKALGNSGMGKISIASSILSYFLILSSSGLTSYGNKVIAKCNKKEELTKNFNVVLNLQLLYTTVSVCAFIVYVIFFGFGLRLFLWISLLQLLATYFDFTWFFYGINEIKTVAVRNIIIKLLGIILIWFFIKTKEDVYKYLWILGGSSLLANLSVLVILKKHLDFNFFQFDFRVLKTDLVKSLHIILPLFIIALYMNVDRFIILSFLKNYDSVGVYDVSIKFISIFSVLIISLRPLMISKISSNFEDLGKIEKLVSKSISFVFYISIPICIVIFLNAESFINLFLGVAFLESAFIIKILAIQILFTGIGDVFVSQVLISIGQDKKIFLIMCFLCFFLVLLYIIFIPIFGIYGAAISSVIAHFFILFLEFYYVKRYIKLRINISDISKIFIAGGICGTVLLCISNLLLINTYLRLIMVSILALLAYLVVCFLLRITLQENIFSLIKVSRKMNSDFKI